MTSEDVGSATYTIGDSADHFAGFTAASFPNVDLVNVTTAALSLSAASDMNLLLLTPLISILDSVTYTISDSVDHFVAADGTVLDGVMATLGTYFFFSSEMTVEITDAATVAQALSIYDINNEGDYFFDAGYDATLLFTGGLTGTAADFATADGTPIGEIFNLLTYSQPDVVLTDAANADQFAAIDDANGDGSVIPICFQNNRNGKV